MMMVIFVSQCEKNALKKTRRVLDAFAQRIGSRTWKTLITQEGLHIVRKMLKQTASKNTAVSCHWVRSRTHSDMVWIVGNAQKFNVDGQVAVNRTHRNVRRQDIENNWFDLPLIKALTALAALFHDWGKASRHFQNKLTTKAPEKYKSDPLRHEWISCLLLDRFLNNCREQNLDWLEQLTAGNIAEHLSPIEATQTNPLQGHDPLAQGLLWLIVSHHRLPLPANESDYKKLRPAVAKELADIMIRVKSSWSYESHAAASTKERAACFEFPKGLLTESSLWMAQIKRWAAKLHAARPVFTDIQQAKREPMLLHYARLCLMLGDYFYSSQPIKKTDPALDDTQNQETMLYANTDQKTKKTKQFLDEHLLGVQAAALRIAHLLPAFELNLPMAENIAALRKPSLDAFAWQNIAASKIRAYQQSMDHEQHGFFAVNMAGTGCGKTFANAKIMQALSKNGKALRYVLALGLRTLTLQTGKEYRELIGLTNEQLAVLIGSRAILALNQSEDESSNEQSGSDSLTQLLTEDIDYEGILPEDHLTTILKEERDRQFLYAPVLACTIDHMMAATETCRGGRYILPFLRLLSSDLVIDEVDDFSGADSEAIGRLIYLSGALGRKVMISSATISPSLAKGYFNAYQAGWRQYYLSRQVSAKIGCAWIDEFQTHVVCIDSRVPAVSLQFYHDAHNAFVSTRVRQLAKQPARRKARLIACPNPDNDETQTLQQTYFSTISHAMHMFHQQHHTIDLQSQKCVSFGVIRVAHIDVCIDLFMYLLSVECDDNTEIRVMCYHSRQVLLLRHEQEKYLDSVLRRKEKNNEPPDAFKKDEVIRRHLDQAQVKNVMFIIVATPVEEIGRDHDVDWAIIEPSSFRSIIQMAGRVRRHRAGDVTSPNVGILQYNWKAYQQKYSGQDTKKNPRCFVNPGYETGDFILPTHDVMELIDDNALAKTLDATARIQQPPENVPDNQRLAALEHKVMGFDLLGEGNPAPEGAVSLRGYLSGYWSLTAVPQTLKRFRHSQETTPLYYYFNEEYEKLYWAVKDQDGKPVDLDRDEIKCVTLPFSQTQRLWLNRDFRRLLAEYGNQTLSQSLSLRYGEVNIRAEECGFEYCDQFGLKKIK